MSNGLGFIRSRAGLAALVVAVAAGCTDGPQAVLVPRDAFLAKGGGAGPSVSAAAPSFGHQGDVARQVAITGSGFAAGALAAWERNGVLDPKVTVLSTQYVSATQLVATITIAPDAEISLYDVSVTNTDRKKGIGTAMFEITSAEVIGSLGGSSYVNDMNAVGGIAGYYGFGAYIYEDGVGLRALGSGQAWGTDPLGTIVLGRNGDFAATAWVRQGDSSYVAELLPNPGGGGGNAQSGARDALGILIVGGSDAFRVSRRTTYNRPAVWTRIGSTWSQPVIYAIPGTKASIRDLNGSGQAVGQHEACCGIVWENATTYVTLDGLPQAINESGTLIVGETTGPAYWVRDPLTQAWNPIGIRLPTLSSCTGGVAQDVNDDGVIVGRSCTPNGSQAAYWKLDMSGVTPVLVGGVAGLPGLGSKSAEKSDAVGVSPSAPYVVAGTAAPNGHTLVVRWVLP